MESSLPQGGTQSYNHRRSVAYICIAAMAAAAAGSYMYQMIPDVYPEETTVNNGRKHIAVDPAHEEERRLQLLVTLAEDGEGSQTEPERRGIMSELSESFGEEVTPTTTTRMSLDTPEMSQGE